MVVLVASQKSSVLSRNTLCCVGKPPADTNTRHLDSPHSRTAGQINFYSF